MLKTLFSRQILIYLVLVKKGQNDQKWERGCSSFFFLKKLRLLFLVLCDEACPSMPKLPEIEGWRLWLPGCLWQPNVYNIVYCKVKTFQSRQGALERFLNFLNALSKSNCFLWQVISLSDRIGFWQLARILTYRTKKIWNYFPL